MRTPFDETRPDHQVLSLYDMIYEKSFFLNFIFDFGFVLHKLLLGEEKLSSFMHVTIINLWYYNYQISLSFVIVRKLSDHCGLQLFQIFLWKAWSLSSGKTWGGKVQIHPLTSGKVFSVCFFSCPLLIKSESCHIERSESIQRFNT